MDGCVVGSRKKAEEQRIKRKREGREQMEWSDLSQARHSNQVMRCRGGSHSRPAQLQELLCPRDLTQPSLPQPPAARVSWVPQISSSAPSGTLSGSPGHR